MVMEERTQRSFAEFLVDNPDTQSDILELCREWQDYHEQLKEARGKVRDLQTEAAIKLQDALDIIRPYFDGQEAEIRVGPYVFSAKRREDSERSFTVPGKLVFKLRWAGEAT